MFVIFVIDPLDFVFMLHLVLAALTPSGESVENIPVFVVVLRREGGYSDSRDMVLAYLRDV